MWYSPLVLAAALGLAAGIAFACARPTAPPQVGRPAPAPVRPAPAEPHPSVDANRLDGALRGAVAASGATVVSATAVERSEVIHGQRVRWIARTWTVRGNTPAAIVAAIAQAAERTDGGWMRTVSQVPGRTVVDAGLRVRGRDLATHRVMIEPPEPRVTVPRPRVAIIFDDAGARLEDLERVAAIGRPVTIAVLPGLAHSAEVARGATARGLEVLLHQPLEAEDATKALGPGGVTVAMDDAEIDAIVRANLDGLPGVVGVNNHMGSRGTADARVMRAVLAVVRERGLFFVDSVTSPRSLGARLAHEMGIRTAARQVFLDNSTEPAEIRAQARRLIRMALDQGVAVAIGHANRPNTAEVIREMLAEFDRAGVDLVPVSRVVR